LRVHFGAMAIAVPVFQRFLLNRSGQIDEWPREMREVNPGPGVPPQREAAGRAAPLSPA
jgi:hypothetical protein